MEKILFILCVNLPCLLHAQAKVNSDRLGVGLVTMGVYAHDKGHNINDDGNFLLKEARMQKVQYYVKNNFIFRAFADQSSDSSRISITSDSLVTINMNVTMQDYSYLIKYDSSLLYYYHYKKNKIDKIIRYPLDSCTFEFFYRKLKNPVHILSLQETEKILINNILCFRGEGVEIETGKRVTFYYHKGEGKFRSPLNTYFSPHFRYNVIRIKFITDWTYNGTADPVGGNIILQVESYNENLPDQKLFMLPPGIPVVDAIPFSQLILEDFNEFKDSQISQ